MPKKTRTSSPAAGEPASLLAAPDDAAWMRLALQEAIAAFEKDEVPVGAVVVRKGRVIGRGHNLREALHDPTAHAEMIALTAAAEHLQSWRLDDCTLFVTLEPCPMCAGAIINARVPRLVFGAQDAKAGACGSLFNVVQDARLNHRVDLTRGVLAEDSASLLKTFFRERRNKGDQKGGPEAQRARQREEP